MHLISSLFATCTLLAVFSGGCATTPVPDALFTEIPIIEQWTGEYPVAELNRLPRGQRTTAVGYIGDERTFSGLWKAFRPEEQLPEVHFQENLVIFSRNVDFLNRTSITKIELNEDVAEVSTIETKSAMPIENKVAMAVAVVPREGVQYIQKGKERVTVTISDIPTTPLDAAYTIENQETRLINGIAETAAAAGSATMVRTSVFGTPVFGDLDGDGDEDAALFLIHSPGGSGTFYYVAGALNNSGEYNGTNAVLLGDRVNPQNLEIRNGVILARYAGRRSEESMSTPPSVGRSKYLTLMQNRLAEEGPFRADEQIMEGWVTIGHEVRVFSPCGEKTERWLMGNSPVLSRIIQAHRKALSDRKRYVPLFMVLAGKLTESPAEGFGSEYDSVFFATHLLNVVLKGNCRSQHLIVDTPVPGDIITSPLEMSGMARGSWFFEGDFPVVLMNKYGKLIGQGFVTAQGNWMTEQFIPFKGNLIFEKPDAKESGVLVFRKDNPTGLAEHDDESAIPVFFVQ